MASTFGIRAAAQNFARQMGARYVLLASMSRFALCTCRCMCHLLLLLALPHNPQRLACTCSTVCDCRCVLDECGGVQRYAGLAPLHVGQHVRPQGVHVCQRLDQGRCESILLVTLLCSVRDLLGNFWGENHRWVHI